MNPEEFEVLFIDDGSEDNSSEIIHKMMGHSSNNWSYIRQNNRGVSSARNKGMYVANGKYIFFLDADDQIPADFLETLWNHAEKDEVDLCWIWKIFRSSEKFRLKNHPMCGFNTGKECLQAYLDQPRNAQILINQAVLNAHNIRQSEDIDFGEDVDFFVRTLLHSRKVHVEQEVFYLSQKHKHQVSRNMDKIHARLTMIKVYDRLILYCKENFLDCVVIDLLYTKRAEILFKLLLLTVKKRDWSHFSEFFKKMDFPGAYQHVIEKSNLSPKWRIRGVFILRINKTRHLWKKIWQD